MHSYGLALALNGDLLISSQDTYVATRVTSAGIAAPTAPSLASMYPNANLFPGTWAPN